MSYVLDHDPKLSRLYATANTLLKTAPDGDTGGEVEIRRYQDEAGEASYTVNQYSNNGGWSSPSTTSLPAATLASELLTIAIGAVLVRCAECDQAEEGLA